MIPEPVRQVDRGLGVSGEGAIVSSCAEVIAEIGVNHDGLLERALRLVEAARQSGADAVKFQTFRARSLAASSAPLAGYQELRQPGGAGQLEMLEALELSRDEFREVVAHCERLGIEFLSTPFDVESAVFLCGLGVRRFKVGSGDLTNIPLLERIGGFRLPVLLSTGMATDPEIEEAVETLERHGAPAVTLLHCISRYPTPPEDLQLLRIPALRERYARAVGFSDHSIGTEAAVVARSLGAVVIEKHLTLDRALPGPDHAASADPVTFSRMVRDLRAAECMLGTGSRRLHPEEVGVRDVARKSVVTLRRIRAGEILDESSIAVLRPGTGIHPREWRALLGRRAACEVAEGAPLQWDDVL